MGVHQRTTKDGGVFFMVIEVNKEANDIACVHDNSKNNGSIHLKLEHIVVYENSSDELTLGIV